MLCRTDAASCVRTIRIELLLLATSLALISEELRSRTYSSLRVNGLRVREPSPVAPVFSGGADPEFFQTGRRCREAKR